MAQHVTSHDIASRRFTVRHIAREALSELKRIERSLRQLEMQNDQLQAQTQGQTLQNLHNWMVSLNESYIGAVHLSQGNELRMNSDRFMVEALKTEITFAYNRWDSLIADANQIRAVQLARPGR